MYLYEYPCDGGTSLMGNSGWMTMQTRQRLPESQPFFRYVGDGGKRDLLPVRLRDWTTRSIQGPQHGFDHNDYRHESYARVAHHVCFLMFIAEKLGRMTQELREALLIDCGGLHDAIHAAQIGHKEGRQSLYKFAPDRAWESVERLENLLPELFEEEAA